MGFPPWSRGPLLHRAPQSHGGKSVVRGLHHESATHSEYTYEPTINISATLATSARGGIRLDYFSRIGVNVDDITTIQKFLIKERIAVLSAERMQQIEDAIRFAIDLP